MICLHTVLLSFKFSEKEQCKHLLSPLNRGTAYI